jgi:hypothetical protein
VPAGADRHHPYRRRLGDAFELLDLHGNPADPLAQRPFADQRGVLGAEHGSPAQSQVDPGLHLRPGQRVIVADHLGRVGGGLEQVGDGQRAPLDDLGGGPLALQHPVEVGGRGLPPR